MTSVNDSTVSNDNIKPKPKRTTKKDINTSEITVSSKLDKPSKTSKKEKTSVSDESKSTKTEKANKKQNSNIEVNDTFIIIPKTNKTSVKENVIAKTKSVSSNCIFTDSNVDIPHLETTNIFNNISEIPHDWEIKFDCLKTDIEKLINQIENLNKERERLEKEKNIKEKEFISLRQQLYNTKSNKEIKEEQLAEHNSKLDIIKNTIDELDKLNEAGSSNESVILDNDS
uniref:Uncharacterized protein n=1 Tax=viral metagenome TaxID=1070528 RepID=A0A6C0H6Y8_9ZZZZ